jgi:hypothetical protein
MTHPGFYSINEQLNHRDKWPSGYGASFRNDTSPKWVVIQPINECNHLLVRKGEGSNPSLFNIFLLLSRSVLKAEKIVCVFEQR